MSAPRTPTTTATRSTPIPAMAERSTGCGSAGRSAADRRDAGAGAGRVPRAASRDARCSTSAPARAARRLRWRARGARVTGVDASAEMLAVARRRARPTQRVAVTFASRRRARARVSPIASFDAVVCLRVLMHTPDWRQSLARAVPRRAQSGGLRLSGARRARAALQALARRVAPRARRPRRGRTACFSDRADRARRFATRGFRVDRQRTASSCCRSRCTRRSDSPARHDAGRGRARTARPCSAARIAGHARGRAVRVLVTGATGFTGGHLARALAGAGRRRARAGPRSGAGGRDLATSGHRARRRRPRDRASLDRAVARRRRRLSHRRDLPAGRACRTRDYRAVNATAVRSVIEAAAARRRAARRPLQHGRRPRRHRASAGQRGRAAQARRHLPGDEARRRGGRASGGRATRASRSSIARPTGIYGPGDRRLLKLFRGVARRRFVDPRQRADLLPSDLHRRSRRRVPAVRRGRRPRPAAPTSSPAAK